MDIFDRRISVVEKQDNGYIQCVRVHNYINIFALTRPVMPILVTTKLKKVVWGPKGGGAKPPPARN